jgi:hypothetical protein
LVIIISMIPPSLLFVSFSSFFSSFFRPFFNSNTQPPEENKCRSGQLSSCGGFLTLRRAYFTPRKRLIIQEHQNLGVKNLRS